MGHKRQEWNMSVYIKLEKHTPSRERYFSTYCCLWFWCIIINGLFHTNNFVSSFRWSFTMLFYHLSFIYFVDFFAIQHLKLFFNKTFTPNKPLGCHCIHNQRTITLLCFTSLQAQMSGQH